MNIQNEILKAIEIIIDKKLEKYAIVSDVQSIVTDVKNDKYKVFINGSEYWVKCGFDTTSINIGTPVWVHLPNGNQNFKSAFIIAKR